jgi:hypothetical protein
LEEAGSCVELAKRTGIGPEDKKKERPLRRSLLVNTGRDERI